MVVKATFFARSIVTFFTIICEAEFWQNLIAKHCYILSIFILLKAFFKKIKKNYRNKMKIIFSVALPKNSIMVTNLPFLRDRFGFFDFWTFFLSIFEFPKKVLRKNTEIFHFTWSASFLLKNQELPSLCNGLRPMALSSFKLYLFIFYLLKVL